MFFEIIYLTVLLSQSILGHFDHSGENRKLSEEQHFQGTYDTHNYQYDHDAFLGKQHGHDFDTLSPEESKRRLRIIVAKIDVGKDGFVDIHELEKWISHQRTQYMWDSVDEVIRLDDKNGDKKLSWEEFKAAHYGVWDDENKMEPKLKRRLEKDKRKFSLADENKDGSLDRDEYVYFRHPEESDNEALKNIAVEEVLHEIDKDDDGIVSIKEFMGQYNDEKDPPEWVVNDRTHFLNDLDKDGSGVLEPPEVYKWVVPNYEDVTKEAEHLIDGADDNGDGKLATEEIILHFELFVGSTATDHGRTLKRHEEF